MNSKTTAPRIAIVSAIALIFATPRLLALNDHIPVGVTGAFEGVTTTGGAYNVLNHAAIRQIDDIVVPGAIGKYGLKMTRYYNSRRDNGDGWGFEYHWEYSYITGKVSYPNGAVLDNSCIEEWALRESLGPSDWWVPNFGGTKFRLSDGGTVIFNASGVATQIIDPYGQEINITLANGRVSRVTEPGGRYLEFTYQSGLLKRVDAYDGDRHRIDYVIYNYTPIRPSDGGTTGVPINCLTRVDYSDGTQAFYTYQDDNVPEHSPPLPCPCSHKIYPLLKTCQDVRYNGPMRNICYDYQALGPHGAIIAERYSLNASTNGPRVSSIDPPAPSPIVFDPNFETTYTETRGGDGNVTRRFTYTPLHLGRPSDESCPRWTQDPTDNPAPQQFLKSYTDFQDHTTWLGYDTNWYINSVTDARGSGPGDPNYTTTYVRGPPPPGGIGQVTDITYPANTGTVHYDYQPEPGDIPGHYLTAITIQRGANPTAKTIHARDGNHRITNTDYMEGNTVLARETFTYCDQPDVEQCSNYPLGQIKTQKLKNGAYVHYKYDPRGLLLAKTEPTWIDDGPTALSTAPKTTYTYYSTEVSYSVTINGQPVTIYPWADRVKTVTLPPNTSGLRASETHEYDRVLDSNGITNPKGQARPGRGLVTKIIHADGKYRQFKYDAYGNKRWEDNELRNITTYSYDDYNRLLNVTGPLSQVTSYTYNPPSGTDPRTHTTNSPDSVTVRTSFNSNILTTIVYDENLRKTSTTVAGETTRFHYDQVGNQDCLSDPRGTGPDPCSTAYTTHFDYDARNRKWQIREPLGRTNWYEYGDNINITKIHRPDGTVEDKTYDGMNRLRFHTVPKTPSESITTELRYNPWNGDTADNGHSGSLLKKIIDGESHAWEFKYDAAGLKIDMKYPDGSTESWGYDDAHNLKNRVTTGNETQNFQYDNRNRKTREWWDGYPAGGEWRNFVYDDASHLQQARNGTGAYGNNLIADVTRTYDDAGRLTLDRQTVYVNNVGITKDVNYPTYDNSGKLLRMYVSSVSPAYDYTFSYDNMGRFEKIFVTGNNNATFQYSYDPASNETQRYNWVNHVAQNYFPDELNRTTSVEVKNTTTNMQLGLESYDYYAIGRLHTVTREDNKQDEFVYYLDGELQRATYGVTATPPPGGIPAPPNATAATDVTSTGFTANWRSVNGATGYRLDVSTSSTFATYVAGYQNLDVGNVPSRTVAGLAASTTYYYRVRAYNGNGTSDNSNMISVITVAIGQVATPTFQPDGLYYGACANSYTFNVTISSSTSGATIMYTTDGSTPSRNHGTQLANGGVAPVLVLNNQTKTLQAMAYKMGMIDSGVHSADFTFERDCGDGLVGYPLDNAGPPPAGPVAPDLSGTFTYTLDKAGNRTAVNTVNYSPNSINQYTSVGGGVVENGTDHQIETYGGFTYTYMRDQELTRIAATGLTFDVAYDALGRCVRRTANGDPTYFIYDGDKPILEFRSNGPVVRTLYGKGVDEILQRTDPSVNGGHAFYFQQDHEGSVTHLTNYNSGSGRIIERYRYDVFGAPTIYDVDWNQRTTSSYNNRFLFTGREYMGAWVYDYRARLYHAYIGRFMSEDPKGFVRRVGLGAPPSDWTFVAHPDEAELNLFRYCGNDPIDFTDPTGLMPDALGAEPEGRDVAPAVVLGHAAIIGVLAAPAAEAAVGRAAVGAISRSPTVARVVSAIGAAFKGEQARNSSSSSAQKSGEAVFWSGRQGANRAAAEAFAKATGKTTLEMTPAGRALEAAGGNISQWKTIAGDFARSASGEVNAFAGGARPDGVWSTVEKPLLMRNPNVTKIIIQDAVKTSETTIIYK